MVFDNVSENVFPSYILTTYDVFYLVDILMKTIFSTTEPIEAFIL
jgi:hypothetical protein